MEINTELTDEIVCPQCGHEFSDSWDIDCEDGATVDCQKCDQSFWVVRIVSVNYTSMSLKKALRFLSGKERLVLPK